LDVAAVLVVESLLLYCDKETVETAGRYEPVLALAPAPDLAL